jgi:hypothetical protein
MEDDTMRLEAEFKEKEKVEFLNNFERHIE